MYMYVDEMEKEKTKKVISKKSRSTIIIIFTVIALAAACVTVYRYVTDIIVDTNIENMRELAEHDKQSIENTLISLWDNVDGIAKELRKEKYENMSEMFSELASKKIFLGCQDLILVDTEGNMYHANGVTDTDNDYREIMESHAGNFICRYDNVGLTVEKRKELLLIGMEINAFSVEGVTFCNILEELDVNTLQDRLRIGVYNGDGYSSVIDNNGAYIVSISRRHSLHVEENFFKDFAYAQFDRGHIDSIAEEMKALGSGDIISTVCKIDGETRIMILTPIESADWYYVMNVPKSIFEAQSTRIVSIYATILVVILIIIFGAILLFVRTQQQKAKQEAKYHGELAEAYRLAQQANRAKTTFLNNMSHDIRTPMNAIIGYTALAAAHIDNLDTVKDYLDKITRSSNHLLSLINDVLDMSRIESGKVNIIEREESLSDILHNLKDIIQADVKAKQLVFSIDTINITDEKILCDKLRLNQVLLNILSNAVKYTEPGGNISMRITEKQSSRDGCAVYEFSVKDNGIGMSEEFAATVFDPFTREETSTVSGIQGTGLGMAITKNIVDMMNGTIVCNSTEHVGTEFIVTLEFRLQTENGEISTIAALEGLRGMVVDDDVNSCQSMCAMLRQAGMRPEWCVCGREAVAGTEEAIRIGDRFRIYIIARQLPDMDGIEAARLVREAAGEEAPVIIMTTYDVSYIETMAAEAAGVKYFVDKPIFPSNLFGALMKACGERIEDEEEEILRENDFTGKKLLLVEDNEINQEIAKEILTEAGFVIEIADNGKIACDILQEKGAGYYDLVLMDVQMPVMDGYEATRTIRMFEDKELAGIPIIAMTANAFAEDKQTAQEAGMDGHIAKPIDVPKLFETLQMILNKGDCA